MLKLNEEFGVLVSDEGYTIGKKGNKLKPTVGNGYAMISLRKDGKTKSYRLHRLIVETFIGSIPKTHCVNHIDGDKLNNELSNLEIVTYKENTQHAYRTGLAIGKKGNENSGSKLSLEQLLEIYQMIKDGGSNELIGDKYNLHSRYISLLRHGKRWKHIYSEYFKEGEGFFSSDNLSIPKELAFKIMKQTLDKTKTNTQIAREFDIDQSTVCRIRLGKTWKNLWKHYYEYGNATTIEITNDNSEESRVHCK